MKRKISALLMLAALAAVGAAALMFYSSPYETVKKTGFALDTVIEITAYGKNAAKAADSAIAEVNRIDRLMSAHEAGSEIYAVNSAPFGSETKVSDEVFSLLERAAEISEKTGGAFDITLKPLSDLWNIKAENPSIPAQESISSALSKTGIEYLKLDESAKTVSFKKEGMGIDLGAIAKGYAADCAASVLKQNGIKSALIDLGGNVYTIGKKSNGKKWKIGLQTPWAERGEYFKTVEARDCAVVTSGAYERFFEKDGKIYHHILNPATGCPAESGIQSATVICSDSALADALSTAVFVLGRDKAEDALKNFKGVKTVILEDDGTEYVIEN